MIVFASSKSWHDVPQRSPSRCPGPPYSVASSPPTALVPLKPAGVLCGAKLLQPWPTLRGSSSQFYSHLGHTAASHIRSPWSHKAAARGTSPPAQQFLVAYRHNHASVSAEPRHHEVPSHWHLLVLPVSVSAHYYVSTCTAITACPSVSSPPPPSLSLAAAHPPSGRHLNLALPYISCDARVHIKQTLPLKP